MNPRYCYWSVADGVYGAMMEHCVRTARQAGVFKEFHVLTDRPLEGCECYDAFQSEKANGLFKLHYLKVGMSRLNFQYFIWVDADTVFLRNPDDPLAALGKSPIHVPLEINVSGLTEDSIRRTTSFSALRDFMRKEGIVNQVYLGQSAFWIIHHDAIEEVYEMAMGFWHHAKASGLIIDVGAALSYAMQILCADPEAHRVQIQPNLWASDDQGCCRGAGAGTGPWTWRHPCSREGFVMHPAIVHLPFRRTPIRSSV